MSSQKPGLQHTPAHSFVNGEDGSTLHLNSKAAAIAGGVIERGAYKGVKTVEATYKVIGKYSRWCLFIGLGLAAYISSLDNETTWVYLFASVPLDNSALHDFTVINTVGIAQMIIAVVGKPVTAKFADVATRGTTYVGALLFYMIGCIVIAASQNVSTISAGMVLYAIGSTGLQLLTQIIIADITTLQWRGLASALSSAPFIINVLLGSRIANSVLDGIGWRWGYGMFAILLPAALAPLVFTLLRAERNVKSLGTVKPALRSGRPSFSGGSFLRRIWRMFEQLDIIGLSFLGVAISLIGLSLILSQRDNGWNNGSIIAMVIAGVVMIFVFAFWDFRFAKHPVVAPRLVRNKTVVLAALISFFDSVSFSITYKYLFSFILFVESWSEDDSTYVYFSQAIALTAFATVAGAAMRYLHRYKNVLVVGLVIRSLATGIMIHSRGAKASRAAFIASQILQGVGGGFVTISSLVGAQASVPHVDVAVVTAVVLLIADAGTGIGRSIAVAIQSNTSLRFLAKYLPGLSQAQLLRLHRSLTSGSLPGSIFDNSSRQGLVLAYYDTMHIMVITATVLSLIPLLLSFLMPNLYLGDKQNAVDAVDLTGEREIDDVSFTDFRGRAPA